MSEFPRVQGRCPACGGEALFLADGGHVTCSRLDCADPSRIGDLLQRPTYHILELGETHWAVEHAITCFPKLLDCDIYQRVSWWLGLCDGPPAAPGRYRIGDEMALIPLTTTGGTDG